MKKSIVVGITGQTGAGKSTICRILTEKGAAVIDADMVAREVMQPGSPVLRELAEIFGEDILDEDGVLIRSRLAERAFADRKSTDRLSKVTHPYIISKTEEYIEYFRNKHYNVIVFDAPQLFESGGDAMCDKIIAVTAPEEIRKKRIMERDKLNEKQAVLRIKAQHDASYYTNRADIIIDGTLSREILMKMLSDYIGI